jgi:uncharacterized protein (TIGR02246 family)
MLERSQLADIARIDELWRAYAAAVNDGDLENWISLWIDEGIQMPPAAPRRIGKEQIRAEMQTLFDRFDKQMTLHLEEIQVEGDQAYSHGTFDIVMTPKGDGNTIQGSGKFLTILQRQIDGSWKIAVDCFNYDVSLEEKGLNMKVM